MVQSISDTAVLSPVGDKGDNAVSGKLIGQLSSLKHFSDLKLRSNVLANKPKHIRMFDRITTGVAGKQNDFVSGVNSIQGENMHCQQQQQAKLTGAAADVINDSSDRHKLVLSHLDLASNYLRLNSPHSCIQNCNSVLKLEPKNCDAMMSKGRAYLQLFDKDDLVITLAMQQFKQVLEIDEHNSGALELLNQCLVLLTAANETFSSGQARVMKELSLFHESLEDRKLIHMHAF